MIMFIIRGLPGSGKSTLAKFISETTGAEHYEADMYFVDQETNEYKFDPARIGDAHNWCKTMVRWCCTNDNHVVVSNTFTQDWEMKDYEKMAEEFGYTVFHLIVENRHGGENAHDVPEDVITKMRNRFSVKL